MTAQINELRKFILNLDERIARRKKQGQNTERLQDNKARALATIQKLKLAQNNNGLYAGNDFRGLESEY